MAANNLLTGAKKPTRKDAIKKIMEMVEEFDLSDLEKVVEFMEKLAHGEHGLVENVQQLDQMNRLQTELNAAKLKIDEGSNLLLRALELCELKGEEMNLDS